jgi:N-acetylglucosamine-6-phosphate deacetylase
MIANSLASPEGSILTSNGWVTGKVEFAGHAISVIDGRTLAPGAKPKGPFVLPGFIDLHVHGGGGGDWQGGEEGVRTFVRYHTSYGTTVIAPTTAIGPVPVIEKSLSAITSIAAARRPGEAVRFRAFTPLPTPARRECRTELLSGAAVVSSRRASE